MEKISAQVFDGTGSGEIRIECDVRDSASLADLHELQGELKSLSDEDFSRLKREILTEGFSFPVCVWQNIDGTLLILDGHQRTRVLRQLEYEGWRVPPVPIVRVLAADLASAKAKLLAAAGTFGKIQEQGLYEFLSKAEFKFEDIRARLALPGLDLDHFAANYFESTTSVNFTATNGKCDPDETPEPPVDPTTCPGDIYVLGPSRLLCGDALNGEDVAKLMNGEKAAMVWTDPPYNVAYEGKTADALTIQNDEMGDEQFYKFLFAAYSNMLAHTRAGGGIYVAHADSEGANFRLAMRKSGWLLKQCLIWVKNSLVMGRQDYHWKHEPILYGWAPGAAHTWSNDRCQTTVLNFDRPTKNTDHPTMKPVALVRYMIENSSVPSDLILDLFGGSGTTLLAATAAGRRANLLELDPRYCDVIVRRWEAFTGEKAEYIPARAGVIRRSDAAG